MLREAEMWAVFARAVCGRRYPAADLEAAWRLVLLNQFHDIIPGSSIERVYAEALAHLEKVQGTAGALTAASTAALAGAGRAGRGGEPGRSLTVFNSLSWQRTALVALPAGSRSAKDAEGRPVDTQAIDGTTWAEVTVPSVGWTTLTLETGAKAGARGRAAEAAGPTDADAGPAAAPARAAAEGPLSVGRRVLENGCLQVAFDERGEISSIRDKESGPGAGRGPVQLPSACTRTCPRRGMPGTWTACTRSPPCRSRGGSRSRCSTPGPSWRGFASRGASTTATSCRWSACAGARAAWISTRPSSGARATRC